MNDTQLRDNLNKVLTALEEDLSDSLKWTWDKTTTDEEIHKVVSEYLGSEDLLAIRGMRDVIRAARDLDTWLGQRPLAVVEDTPQLNEGEEQVITDLLYLCHVENNGPCPDLASNAASWQKNFDHFVGYWLKQYVRHYKCLYSPAVQSEGGPAADD